MNEQTLEEIIESEIRFHKLMIEDLKLKIEHHEKAVKMWESAPNYNPHETFLISELRLVEKQYKDHVKLYGKQETDDFYIYGDVIQHLKDRINEVKKNTCD